MSEIFNSTFEEYFDKKGMKVEMDKSRFNFLIEEAKPSEIEEEVKDKLPPCERSRKTVMYLV